MITVIDNNKQKLYPDCTINEAAKIVHISDRTIIRWGKNVNKFKEFNNFILFFKLEIHERTWGSNM
jgi:DNA-binding MurR/RpiR family transcriptional regulator